MRTGILYILIWWCAWSIQAQEVRSFRQHNMRRWGIPAGNYSGITHIAGDRYALISDKQEADGWTEVSIRFLPSGDIGEIRFMGHHFDDTTRGKARDSEGIAYVPGKGFYVSAENDQRIVQLTEEGTATGHGLQVPECFSTDNIWPNYGFEALTYEPAGGVFWTTTEQGLRSDTKAAVTADNPSPTQLRLQEFDTEGKPLRQLMYQTDAPTAGRKARIFAFGVPELLAIDDSTLMVMERELYIPRRYMGAKCRIRLYSVNTKTAGDGILTKRLVHSFSTGIRFIGKKNFANYEGMCLGPQLEDGRQTILLIADSQNRAGNALFHLKDYIRVIIVALDSRSQTPRTLKP